ncbi:hypothetical protein POJ06DRAFT_64259 [Lipomyces tetrasporus]|uniref:Mitochondrial intermediate peptidase n=1 Tax=Lipomyces tetrasporus TaxID=54092 RepID=A0AAD7VV52_9ASCO|nr:uncharacterized protein POJ06DRAFT_64259 [Lipomyces tetrasporus]KAJ8103148.1 hypothetical protein POJ06DRAFT_64259 [Lipomyces tetrasporus]
MLNRRLALELAAKRVNGPIHSLRPSCPLNERIPLLGRISLRTVTNNANESRSRPLNPTSQLSDYPTVIGGSVEADDKLLRTVFDMPASSHKFLSPSGSTAGSPGLLMNSKLKSARSLVEFASDTLDSARKVTDRILSLTGSSEQDLRGAVRLFDRLSDMLCRVIDLAEFVRTVHPDPEYIGAAEYAHGHMMSYMIELNSSNDLYQVLRRVIDTPSVVSSLSTEENIVAKLLLYDFEKSGAGLDKSVRDEVMSLQHDISSLSRDFVTGIAPEHSSVEVDINDLYGLDPMAVAELRRATAAKNDSSAFQYLKRSGSFSRRRSDGPSKDALDAVKKVRLPTTGLIARMAGGSVKSSELRRQLYIEGRRSNAKQVEILESLLTARMRLANMMGSSSYAEYQLADKMARTPEAVKKFLDHLAFKTRPGAQQEIDLLKNLKKKSDPGSIEFNAWDRDYYMSQYTDLTKPRVRSYDFLNSYFSLGVVMQGLSRLFTKLYGIRFVPRETAPGEIWHEDVRKLDIMSDSGGIFGEQRVGVMYCDLFARQGKPRSPAHYTIRCSREIFSDEFHDGLDPGNRDVPTLVAGGQVYQVPTIGLVCDFVSKNEHGPTLLSFGEVETLFHEMGHAMHSMLGRTALHNISGTRCATDFVELPSVLMEYFASNPDVLALFARHYETDKPLPPQLIEASLSQRATFRHNDTYTQIEMSLLDQALHSITPSSLSAGGIDSSKIYHAVEHQYSLFPTVQGAKWQGMFGHLVGYGAVYYAYLLDRAIASLVWDRVFHSGKEGGAVSREAGERFKNEVLVWGGGRDPWECFAEVLERDEFRGGGESAMEYVAMGAGEQVAGAWR